MKYDGFLNGLKSKNVKDLFWALASESPLCYENSPVTLFPLALQEKIVDQHLSWFLELDSNPQKLDEFLAENSKRRLGVHFEQLLHFFFKASPFINLLLCNQQIIENGTTLGEVDFILEFENQCYHLEVSIKFYLQNGNEIEDMLGPNAKDRLDLKLEKVKNHQLQIAHHASIRERVNREYDSFLFLKGQFYSNEVVKPKFFNSGKKVGKYLKISDFKKMFASNNQDWTKLVKPNWLSSLFFSAEGLQISQNDLASIENEIEAQKKAAHVEQLSQYFFIVSDSWPLK